MSVSIQSIAGRFDSYVAAEEPIDLHGGNSRLYAIEGEPDLLYKHLKAPRRGAEEMQRIEELVEIGRGIDAGASTSEAVRRIAWPRDLVVAGDAVTGVVIPYVGGRFFRPSKEAVLPRDLSYLRRDEEGVDALVRLRLMRQFAEIMAALEFAGLVHGDISNTNLLWAPPPGESIALVDCDGIHRVGTEGGGGTPGWKDPRKVRGEISSHDMRSDWYALSLAIFRVLHQTKLMPPRDGGRLALPSTLPASVRELLERTFENPMDAAARPSPEKWVKALDLAMARKRSGKTSERTSSQPQQPGAMFEYRVPAGTPKAAPAGAKPKRRPSASARAKPKRRPGAPPPPVAPRRGRRRRRIPRSLVFLIVLLGATALLLSGWLDGGPGRQERVEAKTARWAKSRLDARGTSARCPENSSLHAGARYVCTVETAGGAVAEVHVKIGAERGVRRNMRVIAYRRRAVVRDIRARYRTMRRREEYGVRSISCPRTFSARPGTYFVCPVRFTDGVEGTVAVWMQSRRGSFAWREVGVGIGGRGSALR